MIENAVTDLPLPDSPTSPSVSPLRTSNDTSLTATSGPNVVLRFLTLSSGSKSVQAYFAILAEHAAQRVGNLAHGGVRFDGGDDRWHQVVGGPGRARDFIEGGSPAAGIACLPHLLHAFHLLRL